METIDWHDPSRRLIAAENRTAAGTPAYAASESAILMIFNAGPRTGFILPPAPDGQLWSHEIDSAEPERVPGVIHTESVDIAGQSVSVFVHVPDPGAH